LFVPLAEAELAIAQGKPSNALAILDELIRRLQNYEMRLLLPEALYLSGRALLGSGQEQLAQVRFLEALAAAEATGSQRCAWRILCALSQLEAQTDQGSARLHKAEEVLEWILAQFSEQHAHLRETFMAQAEVHRVMAGLNGS
jgi:exonuclease VII small subunit